IQEGKAHDAQNKNEKMYKNLGFLSGLAIAIIFI
ncbi:MAG TPA: stage III sporulation protein AB, partial [Clostridiaceae bacterium]|nr:stage III sporulation protein AB [Clostridiaceae bacterium]